MADAAGPVAAPLAERAPAVWLAAGALRDALITFLIALALFGSLVGLRTDTVNGVLELTAHFERAALFAAIVAGCRFLIDVLIWRRLAQGQTLAALVPLAAPILKILGALGIVFGLILFFVPGVRSDTIEWASGQLWIFGILADLVTFACMASFIVVLAMAGVRCARLALDMVMPKAGIARRTLAVAGLILFLIPNLRTALIAWAYSQFWLLGVVADLLTFVCRAYFIVVLAMAAVRYARLALEVSRRSAQDASLGLTHKFTANLGREFPIALVVVAVLLPLLITGAPQRYGMGIATQILIYIMLGWGLNVVVGLAGLLDLGYVAFYAVGAYTYALISTQFGWSFWVCLPLAGLFAALWGITLGFPVLRLRGDYLAIVTLAFGEIIRIVLLNWQSLTGGPNGINRIPNLTFFGLSFDRAADASFHNFFGLEYSPMYRIIFLYYVILLLALLTNFVTLRLRRLPIGRAWEALREDEIACRSLGINTVTTKLTAFAIGAMFGGLAGAFFSARQGFISPESFTFTESALVLAIVVLGGLGSQIGVVVAAVLLVGTQERFRELQDYRMLIFGLSMVLVMLWRPRGLMAGRTPSAVLREVRAISSSFVKEGRG